MSLKQVRASVQSFMDAYSGKRSVSGPMTPRKGYSTALKVAASEANQNTQFCNRIGCSGRVKYVQNTKLGTSEESKCSRTASHLSIGNKIVGNYSRSNSMISSSKRSNSDSKPKSAQSESDSLGHSQSSGSEAQEPMSLPSECPTEYPSEALNISGNTTVTEIGSPSISSNVRPRKVFQIKSGLHRQNTPSASSVSSVSKSSCVGPSNNGNVTRYDLRSLKRNSLSDVIPPSCLSSTPKSAGKNVMKKRFPERESSLSRSGRKITAASSIDGNASPSTINISNSDSKRRSCAAGEDGSGSTSVRTQRPVSMNNKTRISRRQNMINNSLSRGSAVACPDTEMPVGGSSFLHNFSASDLFNGLSSDSVGNSDGDNQSTSMPLTLNELDFTHLRNRHARQRYNMDGIAEVLLALERIEQDEELTHEQILAMEASFFLRGFNLYDQHRDMRMDIDNMSYEELLALEERMGSVSTAVSEEVLSKCVIRSIYQVNLPEVRVTGSDEDGDDIKCSICQEDYAPGDEIGKLVGCQHGYHISCVNQWLRLKNWCPICKAEAAPSQ